MRVVIQENYDKMSQWAAQFIVNAINSHKGNKPFILGLPTGSSPIGVYKKLIEMNKAGKVSFKNVVTFNMDEYVGLPHALRRFAVRYRGRRTSGDCASD